MNNQSPKTFPQCSHDSMAGTVCPVTFPQWEHFLGGLSKNIFMNSQLAPKAIKLSKKVEVSHIKLKYINTSNNSPLRYRVKNSPGIKKRKPHTAEAVFTKRFLQTEKFFPICDAANRSEINRIKTRYHHAISTRIGAIIKYSRTAPHKSLGAN